MPPRLDRGKWVPKTTAKTAYCLTDRELEALEHEERTNPRSRSGPPMRLFLKEHLERAALAKWGSLARLETERGRRQERREQRSIASYFQHPDPSPAPSEAAAAERQQDVQQPPLVAGTCAAGPTGQQQQGQLPRLAAGVPVPWPAVLPSLLAERVCPVPRPLPSDAPGHAAEETELQPAPQPQLVLYWMQTAVRGHENPALDAAAAAARSLGLPLLAASFLLASHPYASSRRYKFLLEGLRDAQVELRRQGVELLVYVEGRSERQQQEGEEAPPTAAQATAPAADPYQPGFSFHPRPGFQQTAGWRALVRLASRAAVVVTEDMPALARELPPQTQLAAVDASCVLPMRLVRTCHARAYTFRSATEGPRKQRIAGVYRLPAPPQPSPGAAAAVAAALGPAAVVPAALRGLPPLPPGAVLPEQLGWQPLDLEAIPALQLHLRLADLLRRCPGIDHSVPGVEHMRGGSVAGYARWEQFRKRGLSLYAARRNDAMQRDGVSRLSAYHHWGMVSPFKIAREASLDRSGGAAKFLDEFLVWREIGFNTCLHRHHQLHSLSALPGWAQNTLEEHAGDARAVLQYQQLDSGTSGDAFWDAAQRQLVRTGELHNNVRMTWGKAFLQWAPSPLAALCAALHCNHRWALDGCDPASYAGVLWCFGLYDGPKAAATSPISGSLAQRSTAAHGRRLPPIAYSQLPP